MRLEQVIAREHEPLTRRLKRMVGTRDVAEDLRQEAFLRAWRGAPRDSSPEQQAAWIRRTAVNLAIDELRRRRRTVADLLEHAGELAGPGGGDEALAAREALARLSSADRLVLLLRFEAGLSHAEVGVVLEVSPEAARKRSARARAAFAAAWRAMREEPTPLVLLRGHEDAERYRFWLAAAGATPRPLRPERVEQDLALADGLVVTGGVADVDPVLYGERPRARICSPDAARDRADLRALRAALRLDVPIVGVCRGHQLLNVALGGSLYQDLEQDGVARLPHRGRTHPIETAPATLARRLLGRRPDVASDHHQAIRRRGRATAVSSSSPDGVVESIEVPGRSFVLGLQWHPEYRDSDEAGRRIARALVEAAERRVA